MDIENNKRCPKGHRRNKKTGQCEIVDNKKTGKRCPKGSRKNPKTGRCNKVKKSITRKRCPKGYRKNSKTGECIDKNSVSPEIKIKSER